MSTQRDHLTNCDYDTLADALRDACRVQRDLLDALQGDGGLWIDPDRLRFLARRADRLITTAYAVATREGA